MDLKHSIDQKQSSPLRLPLLLPQARQQVIEIFLRLRLSLRPCRRRCRLDLTSDVLLPCAPRSRTDSRQEAGVLGGAYSCTVQNEVLVYKWHVAGHANVTRQWQLNKLRQAASGGRRACCCWVGGAWRAGARPGARLPQLRLQLPSMRLQALQRARHGSQSRLGSVLEDAAVSVAASGPDSARVCRWADCT
jgi:hypothetical protein